MTRMAPKPTDYARRTADAVATLRWRIARKGSLVLTISRADDELAAHAPDCHGALAVRVEIHRCPLVALRMPATTQPASEVLSGRAIASAIHADGSNAHGREEMSEHTVELALCRGDAMVASTLTLVSRAGATPLALTDLPLALGLRGGTYALDASLVERFAASLRALISEDR